MSDTDALTARVNDLAVRHKAGERGLMPELMELLAPLLTAAVWRYAHGSLRLPPSLTLDDLRQELWLIVDRLTLRWDPAAGNFGAFVRSSIAWEVWRYVRAFSPGRRARGVSVESVPHDDLVAHLGRGGVGVEREPDEQIIVEEMLGALDPLAREAVRLHLLQDQSIRSVARVLGMTVSVASVAYLRGLYQLQLAEGIVEAADDMGRLVVALHALAGEAGQLPGRTIVCRRVPLSGSRYDRLMATLVACGAIDGRSRSLPGRLADRTAAATLERLMARERVG